MGPSPLAATPSVSGRPVTSWPMVLSVHVGGTPGAASTVPVYCLVAEPSVPDAVTEKS